MLHAGSPLIHEEEEPIDPRLPTLVAASEASCVLGLVLSAFAASLRVADQVHWPWAVVFLPFLLSVLASLGLLLYALYAPVPYLQQLARLGIARFGTHPSGTELIPLLLGVLLRILLLSLLAVSASMLAAHLSSNHPSITGCFVPLFIDAGLLLITGLLIIDMSFVFIPASIASTAFLTVFLVRNHNPSVSWTAVFAPVAALFVLSLVGLLFAAWKKFSFWASTIRFSFGCLLLGDLFALVFCVIFPARLDALVPALVDVDLLLVLAPGLLALALFSIPVVVHATSSVSASQLSYVFLSTEDEATPTVGFQAGSPGAEETEPLIP